MSKTPKDLIALARAALEVGKDDGHGDAPSLPKAFMFFECPVSGHWG